MAEVICSQSQATLMLDAVGNFGVHTTVGINASRRMLLAKPVPAPRIRDDAQRAVREWILRLPDLTGKAYSRIASEADLAVSTLTKPANNPGHRHVTSTVTIAKIVQTHGVPPPMGFEHLSRLGGFEPEAIPFNYEAAEKEFSSHIRQYIGKKELQAWTLNTRALTGFGYMPRDVLILDPTAEWQTGDIVCAQLYSPSRNDTIWRRFEPPHLIAGSSELAFIRPISVDMVTKKGVVVVMFRPRH